jgi:hypothetical protein
MGEGAFEWGHLESRTAGRIGLAHHSGLRGEGAEFGWRYVDGGRDWMFVDGWGL